MNHSQVTSLQSAIRHFTLGGQEGYRSDLSEREIRARLDFLSGKIWSIHTYRAKYTSGYLEGEQALF